LNHLGADALLRDRLQHTYTADLHRSNTEGRMNFHSLYSFVETFGLERKSGISAMALAGLVGRLGSPAGAAL
jgi:hypothetical protein